MNPLKRSLYLLTIWQEHPSKLDNQTVWRIRLEDTHTGEQHGFTSLQGLTAFLQAQIAEFGQEKGTEKQASD